jgi:hypothetical protein
MNTLIKHLPVYLQVQRLKEEAERRNRQPQAKATQTQLEYLEDGIKAWMDLLTPDQLERRHTLIEIIELAKLQGRHKKLPQYEQIASVLRKYGFINKRAWTKTSRNKRYWIYKGASK